MKLIYANLEKSLKVMKKIIESLFQINLCIFCKFALVVNHMYLKTPFYNRSLIKTLVKVMAFKYSLYIISCNR